MKTRRAPSAVSQDIARYVYYDQGRPEHVRLTASAVVRAVLAHQGLQAMLVYRLGRYIETHECRALVRRVLRMGMRAAFRVISRCNDIATGISINPHADVGPGLFIAHYGGVIIGACTIGANCNIGHGVTIGADYKGNRPVIGDRVVIMTGAKLFGEITVGNDAMVGANTVVVRSIPERAVVVGNPATVTSHRGSFRYLRYPGIDLDLAHAESEARTRSV